MKNKFLKKLVMKNGQWFNVNMDKVRLMRHNPITGKPDLSNLNDIEWIELVSSKFGSRLTK